jgi:hypothetical protein
MARPLDQILGWTAEVSTDGHHLIDTNPDQRIGPY